MGPGQSGSSEKLGASQPGLPSEVCKAGQGADPLQCGVAMGEEGARTGASTLGVVPSWPAGHCTQAPGTAVAESRLGLRLW